jgi:alpha-mannosidase
VISSLHLAHDGAGVVLRLYDSTGAGGRASVQGLPVGAQVTELTIAEDHLRPLMQSTPGGLDLQFTPWQVRQFLIVS